MARDFWLSSGFHLLERDAAGRLLVTDDFLRAYLLRPEIRPVEASGPNEIGLHQGLLDEPRRPVAAPEIESIEDRDAQFNYRVWLEFRDRLLGAASVEACYRGLFDAALRTPPLFIDQLVQIIVRNVLDGVDDPLEARAAELFYREQKASVEDGQIMLADLETVEMHASGGAYGSLRRLIVEAQLPTRAVNLDVLDADNAGIYWERDQRHDLVISLNHGRAALAALCRVIERWVRHFLAVEVRVAPLRQIEDWRGEEVEAGRLGRLIALFKLEFAEPADMRQDVAARPVYMALGMDEGGVVRMKPQNLLLNLPVGAAS